MSCVGGSGVGMVVPVSLQCSAVQCSAVYLVQELKKRDKIERFYFSLGMLKLTFISLNKIS